MRTISFTWPSGGGKRAIVPVFIPFAGCPVRCVYCAQTLQTGSDSSRLEDALSLAGKQLLERKERGLPPAELAFYGGTFTAQRKAQLERSLEAAGDWMDRGLIDRWRCSTRPDCLEPGLLKKMRGSGCACVELGIQSLEDHVLEKAGRGYAADGALTGMDMVVDAGLELGAQLLPGLPGSAPEGFLRDVATCLTKRPALFRFYPCLVVRSTRLAAMYEAGTYMPWDVATTVEAVARGVALASLAGVPVSRVGVAQEEGFEPHVVAGPRDPALGTKVYARAMLLLLQDRLSPGETIVSASLPRRVQGFVFGHAGKARPALAAMGLSGKNMAWTDGDRVTLEIAGAGG